MKICRDDENCQVCNDVKFLKHVEEVYVCTNCMDKVLTYLSTYERPQNETYVMKQVLEVFI